MKFVLVNGRTPQPQSFCALCCEPIRESYLRELATRLSYCDHRCYVGHRKVAAQALQKRAHHDDHRRFKVTRTVSSGSGTCDDGGCSRLAIREGSRTSWGRPQERSKQQQARWRKALLPTPSQRPNAMKVVRAPEQPPPAANIWQD